MGLWGTCSVDFKQFNFFQLTLELHSDFVRLPLQTYLYSATAAAVVMSRLHEPCSVYYFASFYVRQKVSYSFVAPSYQILATPPSIQCNTKHVSTRIFFLLHTWKTIWTNFKRTARLQVLLTIIRMHDRSFVYTYTYSAMTLDNDLDFHTCMQAETTSIHRLVLLLSVSV